MAGSSGEYKIRQNTEMCYMKGACAAIYVFMAQAIRWHYSAAIAALYLSDKQIQICIFSAVHVSGHAPYGNIVEQFLALYAHHIH